MGNPIHAWVTVCHDGWDSVLKSYFGVSVFFIDPATWRWHQVALGLATPESHEASDCSAAALAVLERYGILETDIAASANDNTKSAVAACSRVAMEVVLCT